MKILHIIPNLKKGGAERLVTDIVRELKKREGVDVRLVLFRNEIEYDIEDIKDVVKVIPASVQLSVWKRNKLYVEKLQAFIVNYQPDVIHTHLFEAEIAPRLIKLQKVKYFSHIHWNTREIDKPKFHISKKTIVDYYVYSFMKKLYNKVKNNFIAISSETANFYIKNLPERGGEVYKLANAIDLERFLPSNKTRTSKLILISVGSLNSPKNQIFQIEIAKKLKELNFEFELKIFGEGEDKEELEEAIDLFKLNDNVFLKGNSEKIEEELKQADVFIHTSKDEPFGLVVVEAMAVGLPVIVYKSSGPAEIIDDKVNGFLIETFDKGSYIELIIQLNDDNQLYNNLKTQAILKAKLFDFKKYITSLIEIYKNEQI